MAGTTDLGQPVPVGDECRRRLVPRATAYATIGLLVAWGIAAAPATSRLLQTALQPFIGPLLILVGLVLLGWIPLNLSVGPAKPGATERMADRGLPAAFLLGVLFGARAGARVVGGLQRWQGPLQTANAWLIVGIGAYLTLSGSLGVI